MKNFIKLGTVGDTPEVPETPPTGNAPLHRGAATEIEEIHQYIYAGGKLLRETISDGTTTKTLDFTYDNVGMPYSLIYNNGTTTTTYYYITNLQGDVMYLVDSSGNEVSAYDYDPYGKVITSTGDLAEINPLRYRGYYYDTETGFYYLQSRYYDPEICRFINADSYASTGQGFFGVNMFAYCRNMPINRKDTLGLLDENASESNSTDGNVENMMNFFGVSTPEDIPALEDDCMVFMESISSYSIGALSFVAGRTIVMDRDKYCEYSFVGIGYGYGVLPVDSCVTGGYVYGVREPSDYAGAFFGASANLVMDGSGGAVAPNGVTAKILGTYGYLSPSIGMTATYYTSSSEKWIYGKANIKWHSNSHRPPSKKNSTNQLMPM